ncbi:hypothetical protein ACTOB_006445 [Actinoplanes oblitus]|uniref:Uncharacterized protein n=1 Tax=Actinoplanes oblitus TaxID=3040509 RepID=A0ABY8W987_9ACTN|nr:hypothetical protein [Actinoplanes oblitus]WIM94421.1 hypothetical protein ACTOB_006445 [Actinoplanes oblitus]
MANDIALSEPDKRTLQVAAYGAITLLSAAGAAGGSPHRIAADGSIALGAATGMVGHVLAGCPRGTAVTGKSVAEVADSVLPALTAAITLLKKQVPEEADNFRGTVLTAIRSASRQSRPSPVVADMIQKITEALDAA